MGLPDKETPSPPPIKMGSHELDHIVQARKTLDDVTELARYAALYQNLGWSPVALDEHSGAPLKVDFSQPQATWSNLLMDLALKKARVSLALFLEPDSRLFILKVNPAFGTEFLDTLGDWRSPCVARAGDSWEQHFLVLPQSWSFPPEPPDAGEDVPLAVLGPGNAAPVPPAAGPAGGEPWRWVRPPWQDPPWHPSPGLLLLLAEAGYITRRSPPPVAAFPAWEDLYPVICRSPELLQALRTPAATQELYHRAILQEALRAGFQDPGFLQGLLWHAPHGVTKQGLEARRQLSQWAQKIERLLAAEERPGNAAAASFSEKRWKDLNFLATLASELEQQIEELERQQSSPEVGPGGGSAPLQPENMDSPDHTAQNSREELEELRRALEELLVKQNFPEAK